MPETDARIPAKKSLGQNFLVDANIARKIVGLLDVAPGDRILEIGPGQGALTRWLTESPAAVVCALEKDRHWAREMRRSFPAVGVALMDATRFSWDRLGHGGGWKVVGNLPYNVASPLLWDLAAAGGYLRGVFMVQKEVAGRLAAAPGGKDYGALSVWVQSFARIRTAFGVGPQVFRPRPKVDSAVTVFLPLDNPLEAERRAMLARVLKLCFQQRRKQLRTILRANYSSNASWMLERLGLSGSERPETLPVKIFHALALLADTVIPA